MSVKNLKMKSRNEMRNRSRRGRVRRMGRSKKFIHGRKKMRTIKRTEGDVYFVCHVEGIQFQIKMNLLEMGFGLTVQSMAIIMKVNLRTSLTKFHLKIFEEVHSVIISKIITLESVFDAFSFLRLLRFKISNFLTIFCLLFVV